MASLFWPAAPRRRGCLMDGTRRRFLTTAVTAVGVAATRNLADSGDHVQDQGHEAPPLEDTMITGSFRLSEAALARNFAPCCRRHSRRARIGSN